MACACDMAMTGMMLFGDRHLYKTTFVFTNGIPVNVAERPRLARWLDPGHRVQFAQFFDLKPHQDVQLLAERPVSLGLDPPYGYLSGGVINRL